MRPSSCVECRHGTIKTKRIKAGFDRDTRKRLFKLIPQYHCMYKSITHSLDQDNCYDYVGHLTMFEYLMMTQPDEVNKLLTLANLRVVHSRNKWGFDFK